MTSHSSSRQVPTARADPQSSGTPPSTTRPIPSPPRVDHWAPALRSAALLTGTLVRSGPGLRPVSWPDTEKSRCAALGGLLLERYAAAEQTAAWIWGACRSPGPRMRLITLRGRAPAGFELVGLRRLASISHFRLVEGDIARIGEYGVTSRSRTVYDLLRSPEPFTAARLVAARLLMLTEPGIADRLATRADAASPIDRTRVRERLRALGPTPQGA
ncbi:hypothetical protein ACF07D_08165 [Leucobacter sp. NPDC015123]|uniref:hypothetical protein n=1 Tax=Leucobacter sp. NPDC015123 TaxID=3364129 RepID=UPI0036F469F2